MESRITVIYSPFNGEDFFTELEQKSMNLASVEANPNKRFIKIGAKTYSVLEEIEPTKLKVKLVHIESKFGTKVGEDQKPFIMDVNGLYYSEVTVKFLQDLKKPEWKRIK